MDGLNQIDVKKHGKRKNVYSFLRDEVRLSISSYFYQYQKLSFQDIVHLTGRAKSTVSHHLKILQDNHIIKEVPVPGEMKRHGKMKYYSLIGENILNQDIFPNIPKLSKKDQEKVILELFDFGRSNFIFIRNIINQIIERMDRTKEKIDSFTENPSDFAQSQKKKIVEEVFSLVQNTKFMAYPLQKDEFQQLQTGMMEFVEKFMQRRTKKKYKDDNENINWALAIGFPFSQLNRIAELCENVKK